MRAVNHNLAKLPVDAGPKKKRGPANRPPADVNVKRLEVEPQTELHLPRCIDLAVGNYAEILRIR
jgi:hypothetical protein